jgi:hypothetical protein
MAEHLETNARSRTEQTEAEGDDAGVQKFLDTFARALTAGDGRTIATMWDLPALLVWDQGIKAVTERNEVEQFFAGAKDQYNQRGITDTRAQILYLDRVTERIAVAKVRWPYIDARGNEVGEESSTYTLRRGDDGKLKVCVVVMHGETKKH